MLYPTQEQIRAAHRAAGHDDRETAEDARRARLAEADEISRKHRERQRQHVEAAIGALAEVLDLDRERLLGDAFVKVEVGTLCHHLLARHSAHRSR